MNLYQKINKQKANIAIVGLGYVGLPLSYAFLSKGFKVIGIDVDKKKIQSLKRGKSYLSHIKNNQLSDLIKKKKFIPSLDFKLINSSDVIIICVPTPLNKFREPDLSIVLNSASRIKDHIKKDQLIILESSTYPGTTSEVLSFELEKSSLKANKDFFIAYSPEREDPGNKHFNTTTIPKIIGADKKKSRDLAVKLYSQIISEIICVSSSKAAEATKLTENIFRCVNIALVNELKTIYDAMGIDIWEVIDAAATKPFGYMPFYPGPGLGGHCIPVDPFYLTYKAREYGVPTKFIELAGEINTSMPNFVVEKLESNLSIELKKSTNGAKILVVGMSYKKDIDDIRESPAIKIIDILKSKNAKVNYHDNFVKQLPPINNFPSLKGMKSIPLTTKNIQSNDIILILTNHSYIDFNEIGKHSKLIIDTRNALENINCKSKVIKA
tara:strand:- start:155 stop:1471 length:1317 start_codon:yes stop_codon:yes gene_type:complete